MKRVLSLRVLASFLISAVLLLGACGDDDSDSPSTTEAEPVNPIEPEPENPIEDSDDS